MAKVMVTGGAGFIGSHTVDYLLGQEHEVLAVDSLKTGCRGNLSQATKRGGFEFEEADISDWDTVCQLADSFKPESIIHLAALVSVPESFEKPIENFDNNIKATQVVAEAARVAGVKQVVFASSAAVYGNTEGSAVREDNPKRPVSPYGNAKYVGEQILTGAGRMYGVGVTCFRYFNVYGPRQDPSSPYSGVMSIFADRYSRNKGVTIYGDGLQTRDFIFVKDVARFNAEAATSALEGQRVVNLCTGRSTSLLDLCDYFSRQFPENPAPVHETARIGDIRHSLGCPEQAEKLFEIDGLTTVDQGLKELSRSLF